MSKEKSNQDSVLGDYVQQLQKQKAERERKRREQEEALELQHREEETRKIAEAERLRKIEEEERNKSRRKHTLKVLTICIAVCVCMITLFIFVYKAYNAHKEQILILQANEKAQMFMAYGDSCFVIKQYDEAKMFFDSANYYVKDAQIKDSIRVRQQKLDVVLPFTSADLNWARVQGHVKSITQFTPKYEFCYADKKKYMFNRKGTLVSVNSGEYNIKRKSSGCIEAIYTKIDTDWGETEIGTEYVLNSQNSIVKEFIVGSEWGEEINYKNNKRGWCISANVKASGDSDDSPRNYTFTYSDIDSHGNWLKQHTIVSWLNDGVRKEESFITTRSITYWDD